MKENNHNYIKSYLAEYIIELLGSSFTVSDVYSNIKISPTIEKGHYSLNTYTICKNSNVVPLELAEKISNHLLECKNIYFSSSEKSYVNIKLNIDFLYKHLGLKTCSLIEDSKNVMIEFSQPNTHKELHVGHMRNLCIGNSLSIISNYVGNNVYNVTYPGDVGTHVAKSLWYMKNILNVNLDKVENKNTFLAETYCKANEYFIINNHKNDLDKVLLDIMNKSGDYFSMWTITRQWSIKQMEGLYNWANVFFDKVYYESDVDKDSVEYVKELYAKNKLIKDEGSIGIDLGKLKYLMLLKANGTGLYSTKDLLLSQKKFIDYDIDESLFVVDNRQTHHFKQVFSALNQLGYPNSDKCIHIPYEMVELPSGPMSSRKGNIIPVNDLINQMEKYISDKYLSHLPEKNKENISKIIANGAIKYGMLKIEPNKKIIFDMKEWLKLDGNTGSYIQYTAVRIHSLLKHNNNSFIQKDFKSIEPKLISKIEQKLMISINELDSVVFESYSKNKPSIICNFVYTMCKDYNSFYAEFNLKNEKNISLRFNRLELNLRILSSIKKCLNLLGIGVPNEM
jgi:arginyl-tRNA synthetase